MDILDSINKCNTINIEFLLIYALLNPLYGVIPFKSLLFQEILMCSNYKFLIHGK